VYDAIERRLDLLSLPAGERRVVARPGAGPGEYRTLTAVLRIAGDTLLLWDPGNDRVLALSARGEAIGNWPADGRTPRGTRLVRALPSVADAVGHLYGVQQRPTDGDTAALVRVRIRDGAADTLARFVVPQLRPQRTAAGVVRVRAPGFPTVDAWGVFADGRILFVRGDGYQPEIVLADGTRRRAAAIGYAAVPVTSAMRRAHVAAVVREMERRLRREASGGATVTMPRVEGVEPETWPTQLPPIASSTILVDALQRAWVQLTDADVSRPRYDLLDREGRRVAAFRLPAGGRLVALGRESLYVTVEDADGLLELRRYAMPR
jgi:hypothetical protein